MLNEIRKPSFCVIAQEGEPHYQQPKDEPLFPFSVPEMESTLPINYSRQSEPYNRENRLIDEMFATAKPSLPSLPNLRLPEEYFYNSIVSSSSKKDKKWRLNSNNTKNGKHSNTDPKKSKDETNNPMHQFIRAESRKHFERGLGTGLLLSLEMGDQQRQALTQELKQELGTKDLSHAPLNLNTIIVDMEANGQFRNPSILSPGGGIYDQAYARKKKPQTCKNICRLCIKYAFSHVGICILVIGYTLMGAFTFRALEYPNERAFHVDIDQLRRDTAVRIWALQKRIEPLNKHAHTMGVGRELKAYQNKLIKLVQKGFNGTHIRSEDFRPRWSLNEAFLYSLTVITTIGYGNLTPKTVWGKIVTMIYAVFGIPILLLYITNIGGFLAHLFKYVYFRCVKSCCCCCICCRKASTNSNSNKKLAQNRTKSHKRVRRKSISDLGIQTPIDIETGRVLSNGNMKGGNDSILLNEISGTSDSDMYDGQRRSKSINKIESQIMDKKRLEKQLKEELKRSKSVKSRKEEKKRQKMIEKQNKKAAEKNAKLAAESKKKNKIFVHNPSDQVEVGEKIKSDNLNGNLETKNHKYLKKGEQNNAPTPLKTNGTNNQLTGTCLSYGPQSSPVLQIKKGDPKIMQSDFYDPVYVNNNLSVSVPSNNESPLSNNERKNSHHIIKLGIVKSSSFNTALAQQPSKLDNEENSSPKSSPKRITFRLDEDSNNFLNPTINMENDMTNKLSVNNHIPINTPNNDIKDNTVINRCTEKSPSIIVETPRQSLLPTNGPHRAVVLKRSQSLPNAEKLMVKDPKKCYSYDRITVPIWLSITVVVAYVMGGTILFSTWEEWDYIDGSYFCFITLSTIGFGDLVPGDKVLGHDDNSKQKLAITSLYILVGMAILAMCFNLMQEQVLKIMRNIGIRYGVLTADEE